MAGGQSSQISAMNDRLAADSVVERLYLVVKCLSVSEGDIKERLRLVMPSLRALKAADFPAHLRDDFESIFKDVTKYPPKAGEDQYVWKETLFWIRKKTARRLAEKIFKLYADIQEVRRCPLF